MGGAGGAADGRFFNHDNRDPDHPPPSSSSMNANTASADAHANAGIGSTGAPSSPADQFEPLRGLIADLLGVRAGGVDVQAGPHGARFAAAATAGGGDGTRAAGGGGAGALLFNLFGGAAGGALRANFGDYAWGEDGLDRIVTQLMEQATAAGQGNAPPPAPQEAIDKLERFRRTEDARLGEWDGCLLL